MLYIGIIIQARLGSHRLPNKTLLPLGSKTVLEQVVNRAKQFLPLSQIVVATTTHIKDKVIYDLCQKESIPVFRGSEDDVLDRYYQAAKEKGWNHIIRIGADSPCIDPELLQDIFNIYATGKYDYVSNTLEDTFPEGLNAEFFSFSALQESWIHAKLLSEREHVTPYIKKNPQFNKYSVVSNMNYYHKRWTLDYLEDYELILAIYKELEHIQPYFTTQDVLNFLQKNPSIEKINQHIIRNEGYFISLQQEKIQGKNINEL